MNRRVFLKLLGGLPFLGKARAPRYRILANPYFVPKFPAFIPPSTILCRPDQEAAIRELLSESMLPNQCGKSMSMAYRMRGLMLNGAPDAELR